MAALNKAARRSETITRAHDRAVGSVDGGPAANERLTSITGFILILVLAALGVSILRIHELIWVHLFVGMLLIGPLALKLASTGYRFASYYLGRPSYVRRGPPPMGLRLLGGPLVALTLAVMASGIALLVGGPGAKAPWLVIHKASFLLWLAASGIHVLAHLRGTAGAARAELALDGHAVRVAPGRRVRLLLVASAIVAGVIIALISLPGFGPWSHYELARGAGGG